MIRRHHRAKIALLNWQHPSHNVRCTQESDLLLLADIYWARYFCCLLSRPVFIDPSAPMITGTVSVLISHIRLVLVFRSVYLDSFSVYFNDDIDIIIIITIIICHFAQFSLTWKCYNVVLSIKSTGPQTDSTFRRMLAEPRRANIRSVVLNECYAWSYSYTIWGRLEVVWYGALCPSHNENNCCCTVLFHNLAISTRNSE